MLSVQSIRGLWSRNQGCPTTRYQPASLVTWKVSSSWCRSVLRCRIQVGVIWPTGEASPSASIKDSGEGLGFRVMLCLSLKSISTNCELTPESINRL